MKIYCFSPFGFEGSLVTVEVDLRKGIPGVDVVGLADGTIKESRERMRSAIRNSGFDFPLEKVLISLSPADLKKEGSGFDLAIALAVLEAKKISCIDIDEAGQPLLKEPFDSVLVMGELELSGMVRSVRGVHAAASTALSCGITHCIVPIENMAEAKEAGNIKVFGAKNLVEAYNAMDCENLYEIGKKSEDDNFTLEGAVDIDGVLFPPPDGMSDFSEVKNQKELVRALQIAAAGRHNVLAFGPPGCGKTLSMQHFGELLPYLTSEEAQEVTRIYSLAGILPPGQSLIRVAPFRSPHQTATKEGMCGGGPHCIPGEISLAHNGVLFLDEAAEFKNEVLQKLRVPIESHNITVSRAGRSTTYPSNFQLLLAVNPCPCGNFGVEGKFCLCSARQVEMYWKKITGPLLDRVDLRVKVPPIGEECVSQSTAELRVEIGHAIAIQRKRGRKNANLSTLEIEDICKMTDDAKEFLDKAKSLYDLSLRAVASSKKVARTIADMQQSEIIELEHIKEAVSYRKTTNSFDI